jgi:thiamine-phosphate pyrophosphorylase
LPLAQTLFPALKKMSLNLQQPTLYLITSGATTPQTEPHSPEFKHLLSLVRAATQAGIHLIQLREKLLRARVLYQLAAQAAELTRGSGTRLLINDRADIARAANCDGVHLATHSIEAGTVRRAFGPDFIIGVSTHSIEEARAARVARADFAVFGPIFPTPSKEAFGPALGLEKLQQAARELSPFPLLAIGSITGANAASVLRAGASGIAAIRLFSEAEKLKEVVNKIRGSAIQ